MAYAPLSVPSTLGDSRGMARKPRFSPGGLAYHVMNRARVNTELFEGRGQSGTYVAEPELIAVTG
jgi:hypothetical protein